MKPMGMAKFVVAATLLAIAVCAPGQQTAPGNVYAQPKASANQTERQAPASNAAVPAANAASPANGNLPPVAALTPSTQPFVGVIGIGDLLKVSVLGAPDYDQQVRVAGDGRAPLSLIGPVHLAGLTVEQAQQEIRTKLVGGSYFKDPEVSVFQVEYATQGVSVLGEVTKPGVYPILGPRRLFDLISLAGGTTQKAGSMVTVTHRNAENSVEVKLSNDPVKNAEANVQILPGDTVVVSKAGIVYVVGDVHRPSGVIMENGTITVLQAIAMAEGVGPDAKLNSAKIIRHTPKGPVEVPLQLKQILAAKAADVPLQAEDIVFVPNNAAKSATKTALKSIVQTAAGLAIYRIP